MIYMSPESLLCVLKWREMFRSTVYQNNLIAIVVDEAHCVEKWYVNTELTLTPISPFKVEIVHA